MVRRVPVNELGWRVASYSSFLWERATTPSACLAHSRDGLSLPCLVCQQKKNRRRVCPKDERDANLNPGRCIFIICEGSGRRPGREGIQMVRLDLI